MIFIIIIITKYAIFNYFVWFYQIDPFSPFSPPKITQIIFVLSLWYFVLYLTFIPLKHILQKNFTCVTPRCCCVLSKWLTQIFLDKTRPTNNKKWPKSTKRWHKRTQKSNQTQTKLYSFRIIYKKFSNFFRTLFFELFFSNFFSNTRQIKQT